MSILLPSFQGKHKHQHLINRNLWYIQSKYINTSNLAVCYNSKKKKNVMSLWNAYHAQETDTFQHVFIQLSSQMMKLLCRYRVRYLTD